MAAGWAASLCGRGPLSFAAFERIYQARIDDDPRTAFRAAFWLGFRLIHMNEASRGQGWLARAERCLERLPGPCVESGYMEIPRVRAHFYAGRYDDALELATRAAELGSRLGDQDLAIFARNLQGRTLLRQGAREAGLKLLDEAMLAVTAGELAPNITGIIYCSAIESCQAVFALDRVREWTESLRGWCDAQPQLRVFTGACMVSRSEILELAGQWPQALEEARRAAKDLLEVVGPRGTGEALYRQAEIHRLRGELADAEARYGDASQNGRDPQPGLSLLRVAQGRTDVAAQALRRAVAAARQPLARAKLLPALVDSLLAAGEVEEARAAVSELTQIATTFGAEALAAVAARARGALELVEDGQVLDVANVIWCTGYHPSFSWIELPIFDDAGDPKHEGGVVASQPGLYFVGLHFLYSMSSSMIHGVGRDAARITRHVAARRGLV